MPRRAKGDFLAWINANPNSPRAKLERMIVVRYPDAANLTTARNALAADPYVEAVNIPLPVDFALKPGDDGLRKPLPVIAASKGATATQYWIGAMNFTNAWSKAGGWSLVGMLDSGLYTAHPDLMALNGNNVLTGGNYLPVYAVDIGRMGLNFPITIDFNVDEREPFPTSDPTCDTNGDGAIVANFAGHGTHVSGLIAANHNNNDGTIGACKRCGLASAKVSYDFCVVSSQQVRPQINSTALWHALALQTDIGVQVINMSFGGTYQNDPAYCQNNPNSSECLALAYAAARGVILVSASGNNRAAINFPARDARVAAIGGLDEALSFWNEDRDPPPNDLDQCPYTLATGQASGAECGSNYTLNPATDPRQEAVTPARRVLSTMYPGVIWNNTIGCGDDFLGTAGDGQGPCTGTSMASPILAGLSGLLRSINPLVLPGGPEDNGSLGVRDVIAITATPPNGATWDARLGYGRPNAGAAVNMMLGVSRNQPVRNRLTPLFALYSAGAGDWAYTSTPQSAMVLITLQATAYTPQGALTPGYAAFPAAPGENPGPPRASAYVFTTEFDPASGQATLAPLYWLDRARPWPLGCQPPAVGCNGEHRDFLLLTSAAEVQTAVNDGYAYRGLQGYVHPLCSPEPACIPAGAERLYRQCRTSADDCAVFLQSQKATFEAQGYTAAYPNGASTAIGYAYPNVDSDNDGLIDGFERLLGLRLSSADSDFDGVSDGAEYPAAGVPVSDPCSNNYCRDGMVFASGFE